MAAEVHPTPSQKQLVEKKRRARRTPDQIRRNGPFRLKQIEAAKADGRWDKAYDSSRTAVVPDDFLKDLAGNKKAKVFFETLNKTNRYSIIYRLQTAKKSETREKRKKSIIAMLARGEKFH